MKKYISLKDINKSYFIVLKDNEVRFNNVKAQIGCHSIKDYILFDGVNAKQLNIQPTKEWTSGMIGCYISHTQVWKEAIRNEYKHIIIFEDDVTLNLFYKKSLEKYLKQLPNDYDIALLSSYKGKDNINTDINEYWDKNTSWWGAHCYMINVENLKNKINLFDKMFNQIDIQIMELANKNELNVYHLKTPIANQSGFNTTVQK